MELYLGQQTSIHKAVQPIDLTVSILLWRIFFDESAWVQSVDIWNFQKEDKLRPCQSS